MIHVSQMIDGQVRENVGVLRCQIKEVLLYYQYVIYYVRIASVTMVMAQL